jgi:hypothetical protein
VFGSLALRALCQASTLHGVRPSCATGGADSGGVMAEPSGPVDFELARSRCLV